MELDDLTSNKSTLPSLFRFMMSASATKPSAVLNFLLKTFTSSVINWREDKVSAFDELALECIPKEYLNKDTDLYSSLLDVSCFIASLTDGLALEWYKKLS